MEQQFKNYFELYDANNNGHLNFDEFTRYCIDVNHKMGIPPPQEEDVKKLMEKYDTNKDRTISLPEFIDLMFKCLEITAEAEKQKKPSEKEKSDLEKRVGVTTEAKVTA